MKPLGELLRELRGKRSLREIAKETELSHTYISDLEKGFRRDTKAPINPSPETLKRLAEAYNFSYEELLKVAGYLEATQNKLIKTNEVYDSLAEINKIIKEFGIEDMGFFDIEKWKNLSPDDVDEIRRHFEWVAQKAKERNEEK